MIGEVTSLCSTDRRRKLRNSLLKRAPRRLSRIPGWHRERWTGAMNSLEDHPLMDERPDMLVSLKIVVDLCEPILAFES